ncbi:MAG: glycoside hydrolase family 3 C-terminal domain-containing protein, partial [Clostridia bacterium]|nr:glycoside hydrolase family 3 C-terminal domain-containing protein [Clostridia bacterium]
IFRDPRWGRGQETCGEDPFLTSEIARAYIKNLQGDGEFWKATACAKHFAAHSGPEAKRHGFDAVVSEKDLAETYLPAFEQTVSAGVAGVMGAYNRTNGEPCCASKTLMETLRGDWGFEGYFVSDCWAIKDIFDGHHCVDSVTEAAAMALNAGCELNCGEAYRSLQAAFEEDLVTEETITAAAERLFTIRAKLGEFETPRPFADIPYAAVCASAHKALSLKMAEESLVLLENKAQFLPFDANKTMKIAVVGPTAMNEWSLEGNYNGHADEYITVADGVRRVFKNAAVRVADGSPICDGVQSRWNEFSDLISEGVAAAEDADVTLLCLGLDRTVEGEELGFVNDFTGGGDRKTMHLPACQMQLAEAVCAACDNVVVVVLCGSCADLGDSVRKKAKAILHGWYPGALGGLAIANVLSGAVSPSGRLPITFYKEENTLPDMEDYAMTGRTYRYLNETPLYPFGFGLSYTAFGYGKAELLAKDENRITARVTVTNTGERAGREVVQCYARFTDSRTVTPNCQLCAFESVFLQPGESKAVTLNIDRYWLKAVLADGSRAEPDGGITLYFGGGQPDCGAEGLTL